MVETVLFVLMAAAALAGAVTVVLARNPVHSAMGLLATLFSVAVLYVVQLAHLVAAVQVDRLRRRRDDPVPVRHHADRGRQERDPRRVPPGPAAWSVGVRHGDRRALPPR